MEKLKWNNGPPERPQTCTMCNRVFAHGEPDFSWSGHSFCCEGCRNEWIELVMV